VGVLPAAIVPDYGIIPAGECPVRVHRVKHAD
jgi:hypothetical protein